MARLADAEPKHGGQELREREKFKHFLNDTDIFDHVDFRKLSDQLGAVADRPRAAMWRTQYLVLSRLTSCPTLRV